MTMRELITVRAQKHPTGVTACQFNAFLGCDNHSGKLNWIRGAGRLAYAWKVAIALREMESAAWIGQAYGSRCNHGIPSWIALTRWPPCHGCWSRAGHGPELRSSAPLRCGEKKLHPEQCGREWLHAHKKIEILKCAAVYAAGPLISSRMTQAVHPDQGFQMETYLRTIPNSMRD